MKRLLVIVLLGLAVPCLAFGQAQTVQPPKPNTWHWEWDGMVTGKPAKYRFTIVEVSPTANTTKVELSVAGGPWTVTAEGKSAKVK